jgi:DNA polymerase-3 subunit epsilon
LSLELISAQGLNLVLKNNLYYLASTYTSVGDTLFCIVDVETNGSKPSRDQIIEIGAIKLQNGIIIDTFDSLVYTTDISKQIQEITGISIQKKLKAPALAKVMHEFRLFLGDAVFVGHDAKFDYNFVSAMMERVGLEPLFNRSLCTIDLAERTIESERYGLAFLNEQLELYREATHHRALSDAMTTTKLLKRTLPLIPKTIQSCEELISFSKEAKRLKRLKPIPKKIEEEPSYSE